jgi:HK97 family phage portal protein
MLGTGSADPALSKETALSVAAMAYAATMYRAANVSQPPLRVYRRSPEGYELEEGHWVNALLETPHPDFDGGEIVWSLQASVDVYARALWLKEFAGSRVVRLLPFTGNQFAVSPADGRIAGRFDIRTARGLMQKPREEVVYHRYLSPSSTVEGISPLDAAMGWLGLEQNVRGAITSMMRNGMFPSVVISPHQEWDPDDQEFNRFKDLIDQFHAGPANAGKPFVAMGGSKVTRAAFSLRDLLPDEVMDRIEATVSMCYGVPPVVLSALVGLKNSPWSQMEEARRYVYEDTIQPLQEAIARAATRQLLRPMDADLGLVLRFDRSEVRALQRDQDADVGTASAATHWTLDERRVYSGQEALGGERGEWVEAIDGMAATEPVEIDDGGGKFLSGDSWEWSRFDLMAKSVVGDLEEMATLGLDADRKAYSEAARSEEFASEWADAIDRLHGEKGSTDGLVATLLNTLTKGVDRVASWTTRSVPVVASVATLAVRDLAGKVRRPFEVLSPGLEDYARAHGAKLAKGLEKTTRTRLGIVLANGLADGVSVRDLAQRIDGATAFGKARATLIAQTESTAITNAAQRGSMSLYAERTMGQEIVEKAWLDARDSLVRPEHKALARLGWIPVDDPYPNGRQEPGEPNCRCANKYRVRPVEA